MKKQVSCIHNAQSYKINFGKKNASKIEQDLVQYSTGNRGFRLRSAENDPIFYQIFNV